MKKSQLMPGDRVRARRSTVSFIDTGSLGTVVEKYFDISHDPTEVVIHWDDDRNNEPDEGYWTNLTDLEPAGPIAPTPEEMDYLRQTLGIADET